MRIDSSEMTGLSTVFMQCVPWVTLLFVAVLAAMLALSQQLIFVE